MAADRYALNIDAIESAVAEFADKKTSCTFNLTKRDDKGFVYKIEKDGRNATLTLFIVKGGRMSHLVQASNQCSDLKAVGKECWEYILEKTHINCTSCNFFTIKNVSSEDFDSFIELLTTVYNYGVDEQDSTSDKISARRIVKDQYLASVTVNYYNNGTLTIQGALTPLFNNVWIQCVDLVGEIEDEERHQFLSYSTSSAPERISENLSY